MQRDGTTMTTEGGHVPVMPREVLELLAPPRGGRVVDVTLGRGGHSRLIAEALGEGGFLLALDRDPAAHAAEVLAWTSGTACRVLVEKRAFSEVEAAVEAHGGAIDGLLADLGVSSPQLDDAGRGFSFRMEGPLDMRMDPSTGETAEELIRRLDADDLANVIYELGEERLSRRVARALKGAESLSTTREAADVIARVVPRSKDGLHPATRTFQALRLAVNDEMGELDALLAAVPRVLKPGGRAAIISFHSLEDRKVKQAFLQEQKGCICPPELPVCQCGRWPRLKVITRKPLVPGDDEERANPRARSAKLRCAERLPDPPGKVATW